MGILDEQDPAETVLLKLAEARNVLAYIQFVEGSGAAGEGCDLGRFLSRAVAGAERNGRAELLLVIKK